MAQQALNGLARAAVGIGAGVSLFQASVYNVDGGFRAVMFDRLSGVQRAVRGEGTHFRIPWVQTPHQFDVRIRPRNISSATGTKDLQIVTINLRVLSRPEEEHLPDIFSNLGVDYDERVLPSIGNEVLKAVVAQYNAEQLITKREAVSREVRDELTKRATEFHILLEDVSITDLKFGKEFTAAVEAKQVAQQVTARGRPAPRRARAAAAAAAHPPLRPARPAGLGARALPGAQGGAGEAGGDHPRRGRVGVGARHLGRPAEVARPRRAPPHRSGEGHRRHALALAQRDLPPLGRRPEHAPRPRRDGRLLGGGVGGRGASCGIFNNVFVPRTYCAAPGRARGRGRRQAAEKISPSWPCPCRPPRPVASPSAGRRARRRE